MRKLRFPALLLTLSLCLSLTAPAAAYSSGCLLPQVKTYQATFTDTKGTWCDSYVQTVYETGLMEGKSAEKFDPAAPLTYAQIVVITARLHELLNGGDGKFEAPAQGQAWYQPAAIYLKAQVDEDTEAGRYLLEDLFYLSYYADTACNRYDFVWYLTAVLPESALTPINSVTALPDTWDEHILRFYNAGILTGTDVYGTFNGSGDLNRGQAAAMLARVVDPGQRVKFTPKALVASREILGLNPSDTLLTIDGYAINAELYTYVLCRNISYMEFEHSLSYYEDYQDLFYEYLYADYDGLFSDYLLEKAGIDVNAGIDWNTPDKGGLSPAEKVREDTLSELKDLAVLMNHQNQYPLSSAQKAEIQEELGDPYAIYGYTGYSSALAETYFIADVLMENFIDTFTVTASDINRYLKENGYIYGQYGVIYRGDADWYETEAETQAADKDAKACAETLRQQLSVHKDDSEYVEFLLWKYSDDSAVEPDLLSLNQLSQENRKALEELPVGQVSKVLTEDDAYVVVLKLDPSQDEYLSQNAALVPAYEQLDKWTEAAKVVTTPAYDAVDVGQAAAAASRLGL